MSQSFFLEREEIERLTGFSWKSKQIEWLREQGIPFHVAATGHPAVVRSTIEGRKEAAEAPERWVPRVVGAR